MSSAFCTTYSIALPVVSTRVRGKVSPARRRAVSASQRHPRALTTGAMKSDLARDPIVKDLVLIGGGHAHVYVLKMFGMKPERGVRVTLIANTLRTPYSGMLPGLVAGHYTWDETHVDLQPLCKFGNHRVIHDECVGIDYENKRILLKSGRPSVKFDVASVDVGITPSAGEVDGADAHTVPVKPIGGFNARWEALMTRVIEHGVECQVCVVGGGAGGAELALSMRCRMRRELAKANLDENLVKFTLITRGEIMPTHAKSVRKTFLGVFAEHGVDVVENDGVMRAENGKLILQSGRAIESNETIWCTQAGAAKWLRDNTPLVLDDKGFIAVNPTLESTSHKNIFAAGDVASVLKHPRPKAGVFAVRQGPPLEKNLRRALLGEALVDFTPQSVFLGLITTGDKSAVLSYGKMSFGGLGPVGEKLWRWKDKIDRKWMKMYADLPDMMGGKEEDEASKIALAAGPETMAALRAVPMRCGGCGAKVGATVLSRVMKRLEPIPTNPNVEIGIDQPDDAAVVSTPPGMVSIQTVDYFRSFVDDPYIFGQVAAVHALGDCWAMGADPHAALAIASVPYGLEAQVEETLYQMMAGACSVLREAGCALAGGHSCEGAELSLGFSVHGAAPREKLMKKGGMKTGQKIILTKPVGTGTLFAADMRAKAQGQWISNALDSMRQSSGEAARVLFDHGATACTDVTGFGLLGHLVEMCKGSNAAAVLDMDAVPVLPGALECVQLGITSSLQPANVRLARAVANPEAVSNAPKYPLLFDPQTAGGMLASVPAERASDVVRALIAAGYPHTAIIGEVLEYLPKASGNAPERVVFVSSASVPFDGASNIKPTQVVSCGADACNL
jgi:selenide, water dikinase